jgi:uncharacterized repeat protein (TIGR03806 family)
MRCGAVLLLTLVALAGCGQRTQEVSLPQPDSPHERLSDWGIIASDGRHLEIRAGAVPYDLNTPLFSDYAHKLRTAWLSSGTQAAMDADGEIDFPVGTVLSKTFFYPKAADWRPGRPRVVRTAARIGLEEGRRLPLDDHLLIETRLLVHFADGWSAYPYVWNADQDEAYLEIAGDVAALELVGEPATQRFSYVVPDANQCAGCHTPDHGTKQLSPLGPQAWQLNRSYGYGDGPENQLDRWQALGLLDAGASPPAPGVDWMDAEAATLESRARAYLDANCAHCHNAAGAADTSALHLDIEAPVDRHYGICKTPVAVGRGSGDRPYDIYPGRPDDSILVYRMAHSDPAIAMPELGRSLVHAEGLALLSEWIAALNGEC